MIAIRASSIGELFDCAARWEAKHLQKLKTPTTAKAQLGRAIHASTGVYDESYINGDGVTPDEAGAAAVDAIWTPDAEVIWDDMGQKDAEPIALSLNKKYCETVTPKQKYLAVEVTCNKLEITDLDIALTGTTDRLRDVDGQIGIVDLKTGKSAVGTDGRAKTAGAAFQLGAYEIMAEKGAGVEIRGPAQIVGLNTAKTEKSQRIGTGEIIHARDVLLGDEHSPGVLEIASRIVHSGVFPGNPRSMMCHERYCPVYKSCKFRK